MIKRLLIANRGEIAIRIMRTAAEIGVQTVAVFSEDDAASLHTRRADAAYPLRGIGAAAYLDIEQILRAALERDCDAVHPGYGFLSENPDFAWRCAAEGIPYIGPAAETLAVLGDKTEARALAARQDVPVLAGTPASLTVDQTKAFLAALGDGGSVVIKAVAGGGGRGLRIVNSIDEVEDAFARCRSEALQAFGNGDLYAEQRLLHARHLEVQVVGDGSGAVSHLWERECSIQRRQQKLVEVAPCPTLKPALRERLTADAVRMAGSLRYRSLGTFEFLLDANSAGDAGHYAFIEANARLQVEHTVTEEVLDLDLVRIQLLLAGGQSLADLGLQQAGVPAPHGFALQVRINMETIDADGAVRPSNGTLTAFEPPSGRGIRVDSCGYAGYRVNPNFDPLLAKLVCHSSSPSFADAVAKSYRALCEFRIEGVRTNIPLLQNLLRLPEFVTNRIDTGFVEAHLADLVAPDPVTQRRLFFDQSPARARVGVVVDAADPLAVLTYGKTGGAPVEAFEPAVLPEIAWRYDASGTEGAHAIQAPMQATIVSIDVREGDVVRKGQQVLVLNAMKMEHVIESPFGGVVVRVTVSAADTVPEGAPLLFIVEGDNGVDEAMATTGVDLDEVRTDLAEVQRLHAITLDAARPEAVAVRHAKGHRTARENIDALCDPGSFVEYGPLVIGQGLRGSIDERLQYAPADGLIMGLAGINGDRFGDTRSRCLVVAYDYMVLAGTQGGMNHRKKDRILQVA
ncbi:MAG: biotin carboxylase N-terminal domain-containing protein, partial [Dehalococcoidia bacterium]